MWTSSWTSSTAMTSNNRIFTVRRVQTSEVCGYLLHAVPLYFGLDLRDLLVISTSQAGVSMQRPLCARHLPHCAQTTAHKMSKKNVKGTATDVCNTIVPDIQYRQNKLTIVLVSDLPLHVEHSWKLAARACITVICVPAEQVQHVTGRFVRLFLHIHRGNCREL